MDLITKLLFLMVVLLSMLACEKECTQKELDKCLEEHHTAQAYCKCLAEAGCAGTCEWQEAECDRFVNDSGW